MIKITISNLLFVWKFPPPSFQVILNAAVYEGMGVTKKKNMIEFIANVAGDGPTLFMVKVTKEEIDNLHTRVMKLVPSS